MKGGLDDHRANNFDALRVIAALMVIYGHGCVLSGGRGPGLWGEPFARAGLDIFFSISGYLVTGSWERTPRIGPFLAKRGRRIFPGLRSWRLGCSPPPCPHIDTS
jgi:peptidoglycan/LPS O-acetylase OafA/YrhL